MSRIRRPLGKRDSLPPQELQGGFMSVARQLGVLVSLLVLGCDAGEQSNQTSMDGGSVLDSTRDMVDSSVERLDGSVFLDGALN